MGSIAPLKAALGSVVGLPSASIAQPSGISRFSRAAASTLPRATPLAAMSNTRGGPPATGLAKASGLLPMAARFDPGSAMMGGVDCATRAIIPASAACSANMPSAARCPTSWMTIGTKPAVAARPMASPTARLATTWPSPESAWQ